MRPRGRPPMPSAMSKPSDPVGTTCTSGGAIPSPSRMMLPLPNCFSIVATVSSMALSRPASRSRTTGVVAGGGTTATGEVALPATVTRGASPADLSPGLVASLISVLSVAISRSFQRGHATQNVGRGTATGDALVQMNLIDRHAAQGPVGPGCQQRRGVDALARPARHPPQSDVRAKGAPPPLWRLVAAHRQALGQRLDDPGHLAQALGGIVDPDPDHLGILRRRERAQAAQLDLETRQRRQPLGQR